MPDIRNSYSLMVWVFALALALGAETLVGVYPHGSFSLTPEALANLTGLVPGAPADTEFLASARMELLRSGLYDTVYIQKTRINDTAAIVNVYVRELAKSEVNIYGGALSLVLLNEDKFWFAVTPGYERRFLAGRPHSFLVTVTFPYSYGASFSWLGAAFPARTYTMGLRLNARSSAYSNSPYYTNAVNGSLYLEKHLTRFLTAMVSASGEVSKTWRVDRERWKKLDWQIFIPDPDDIADTAWSRVYPRTETVPSAAASLAYDRRNNALYPTKGFYLFAEARRVLVTNERADYSFSYNQATGAAKCYVNPARGQVIAAHLKAVVRDKFDPSHLSHRLIYYDDTQQFRGFRYLAGTNLAQFNLEYRYRLFEMNMDELLAGVPMDPRVEKLMKKSSYAADLFVFADNGLFFGRVLSDRVEDIPFQDLSLADDLFTSCGIGGRAIYPRLGYVATGGITLYQRKPGLDKQYFSRIFGMVTLAF